MKNYLLALGILSSFVMVGCSAGYVSTRPVDVTYERPLSPGAAYVWTSGDWEYTGGNYNWHQGSWQNGREGHTWKSGYWQNGSKGYKWHKGGWQK